MILKKSYNSKPQPAARIQQRPKNLVGYWPLIAGMPDRVQDYSINHFNGTISGNTTWIDNKRGRSLEFDGISGMVTIGSGPGLDNLSQISILAWVYPRSEGENFRANILGKRSGGGWINDWFFAIYQLGTNALDFFKGFDGPGWVQRSTNDNVLTLNKWQHTAVTWDGTANQTGIHIYVNNIEATYAGGNNGIGSPGDDSSRDLIVGNQMNDANTWDGYIWDVILLDRVVTRQEIKRHYLKPLWMFDRPGRILTSIAAAPPAAAQKFYDLSSWYWTIKNATGLSTRL